MFAKAWMPCRMVELKNLRERWVRTILILMCFWMVAGRIHGADPAQALVPTEHNPLYLQFLRPSWYAVSDAQDSTFNLGASGFYANMFERRSNDRFFQDFDNEMASGEIYAHYRISPRLSLKAHMGFHRFSGGFLDRAIQNFHDTFGLPNDDRDEVANQRFALTLIDQFTGTLFTADEHHWYNGSPQIGASWTLVSRAGWDWAAGATLKLPLGGGPFVNSRLDAGVGLHGRKAGNRWRFDFQAGVLSLQAEQPLATITRDAAAYGMAWIERRWWRHTRTFLQIDGATSYFHGTGLNSLDPPTVNLYFGVAQPLGERWSLVTAFGEDLIARGPSLDFSLTLGIQVDL